MGGTKSHFPEADPPSQNPRPGVRCEGVEGVRCEGVLRNHESVPTPQFIERIKKVRFNKTVSELSLSHFSDVNFCY